MTNRMRRKIRQSMTQERFDYVRGALVQEIRDGVRAEDISDEERDAFNVARMRAYFQSCSTGQDLKLLEPRTSFFEYWVMGKKPNTEDEQRFKIRRLFAEIILAAIDGVVGALMAIKLMHII